MPDKAPVPPHKTANNRRIPFPNWEPSSRPPAKVPETEQNALSDREQAILAYLRRSGASFFQPLHDALGGGYPGETIDALWTLVWRGLLTNDALHCLRAYTDRTGSTGARSSAKPVRRVHNQAGFRSRRTTPPTAQGRWSLNEPAFAPELPSATPANPNPRQTALAALTTRQTEWSHAIAQQLLTRYGVVFRETAHAENLPGGFSAIYDVLKALEESGRVRRGYFAADLGATQFAQPAAVDLLRSLRPGEHSGSVEEGRETVLLAATDPANPYGALLRWPGNAARSASAASAASTIAQPLTPESSSRGTAEASPVPIAAPAGSLTRSVGARVILIDGALTAYLRRGNPDIQVLLPEEEPARANTMRALAQFLVQTIQRADAESADRTRTGMLITAINGTPVAEHPMARALLDAGFQAAPMGFNIRRNLPTLPGTTSLRETSSDLR